MEHIGFISAAVLLPFLGTVIGAAGVFFIRNTIAPRLQKLLLGFTAGVMIAASVWSLLIPAIDMVEEQGGVTWLPALLGFLSGMGFLLLLDTIIPHLHSNEQKPEGPKSNLSRSNMLILAITLHNLPEGMAVGVVVAGVISGNSDISMASALALAIGMSIQNMPEGAVISMPLLGEGMHRRRAFGVGVLSGLVEPIGALLMIVMASLLSPALPYILAFAAGAMLYVVIEELIPQAQAAPHSNIGTIGAALGFALMMVLDVALG